MPDFGEDAPSKLLLTLTLRQGVYSPCEVMGLKMQIKEFAEFAGVSVRTLHYYDEIGLLKPAHVEPSTGYRYYDEESLLHMQEILFYRELDFSLQSIREILSSPDYDKSRALKEQKHLLTLKKERLERLISAIDGAMKGENVMNAFENSAFEAYKAEARAKWGQTEAYRQYEKKAEDRSPAQEKEIAQGMDTVMAAFSTCMGAGNGPDSVEAQKLVKALQDYITEHYYPCTDGILAGLGQMYAADERFRRNIDRHGAGTAEFISKAVEAYCAR